MSNKPMVLKGMDTGVLLGEDVLISGMENQPDMHFLTRIRGIKFPTQDLGPMAFARNDKE